MSKKLSSLTSLLSLYYKWQPQIVLVYRPSEDNNWNNRTLFLSDKYNAMTSYNHRIILKNEIVIEFDDDEKSKNLSLIRQVITRLKKDNINYSLWDSGNKSYHCHIFIELGNVTNINLLKRSFIKYYCQGMELPDMQMCQETHLVRAEFGVNEKSGKRKELVENSKDYPQLNYVPRKVWEIYNVELQKSFTKTIIKDTKELLDTPVLKTVLDTIRMKQEVKDGRERILWMLSQLLKNKYPKDELKSFLNDWYSYSGGNKLTQRQINFKVEQAYNKDYNISENFIRLLAEDLGIDPSTGEVKK
jgi:DNA primase catalytic subunit